MNSDFNLEKYLSQGIKDVVTDAMKAALRNPKEGIFLAKFYLSCKKAEGIRSGYEKEGKHIPAFLISSISSSCNLNCQGCYARASMKNWKVIKENTDSYDDMQENSTEIRNCIGSTAEDLMTANDWGRIFKEAIQLGISFILLAGGEPLIRRDVIDIAAEYKNILFPVFTNGTMISDSYRDLFDQHRNLLPVLSIEGSQEYTDNRRGRGVYSKVISSMDALKDRGIFYGASITVTKDNINHVTSEAFLDELYHRDCKIIFFIEYVPLDKVSQNQALTDQERILLENSVQKLRSKYEDMLFLSFPGDEKLFGGCLAAGRGFFHINPNGKSEPCPFSPYSDTNIRTTTLLEALNSPLFNQLRESHILLKEHTGGCVLFEQEEKIKQLLM